MSHRSPLALSRAVATGLLDALYPPRCYVCGATDRAAICANCIAAIVPVTAPFCTQCGDCEARPNGLCRACASGAQPYTAVVTAGLFEDPLRRAIHRLKYERRTAVAVPLGAALAEALAPRLRDSHVVLTAVPLAAARFRARGFNQSDRIAQAAASFLGADPPERLLVRTRETGSQVGRELGERATAVAGAFAVAPGATVKGRTVVVVDDVLTSLATVRECARVLCAAGAADVVVAGCAREARKG